MNDDLTPDFGPAEMISPEPFHLASGGRTDDGLVRLLGWFLVGISVAAGGVALGLVWSWAGAAVFIAVGEFVYGCVLTAQGANPQRLAPTKASTR